MPHKRNPERCEQVVALARLSAGLVAPALLAMGGDGERDARALRMEWSCVPDSSHYCLAACGLTAGIVGGLRIDTSLLLANATAVSDQVASETLTLTLAGRWASRPPTNACMTSSAARAGTAGCCCVPNWPRTARWGICWPRRNSTRSSIQRAILDVQKG